MKKNYELLQVKVISLDNEDVIATSGEKDTKTIGGLIDLGDLNTQIFS